MMKSTVLFLLAACITIQSPGRAVAQDQRSVKVQGADRAYEIHIPKKDSGAPRPLVIALHGLGDSGANFRRHFNLDPVADRDGFVAVYPSGVDRRWNYGRPVNRPAPMIDGKPVDDVEFMKLIIRTIVKQGIADPGSVYLVGSSNGGLMAYRAACELPQLLTAVAALIIGMTEFQVEDCVDRRPVPILILGGTADRIHFDGNRFRKGRLMSMFETVLYWRQRNGCTKKSEERLPDLNKDDASTITLYRYRECAHNADVDYLVADGGAHNLPKLWRDPTDKAYPGQNGDIETAEEVWRFFKRFKR